MEEDDYVVVPSEPIGQKEPRDSDVEDKDDTEDRTAAAMASKNAKTDTEASSSAMEGLETDTENVTRILIIGKAGTGKSTVGNAILDKEMFPVVCGMQAGTLEVSVKRENGVEVIDTPDTGEGSIDNTHFKEIMSSCLHAVLLTIRWNDCTQKDRALYLHTLAVLGDQFPSNRLMVVFTFSDGDSMEDKKKSSLMQTEEKNIPTSQSAIHMKRKMEAMEKSCLEQVKEKIPEIRSIIDDKRYVFFKTQGTNQQRKDILEKVAKLGTAPPNNESKDIADVPAREIRVLIIGKGKTGKSTVGNILLGERRFHVEPDTDAKMTTSFTVTESAVLQSYRITVTDTPDLINADFSRQDIKDEILKWKSDTMTKRHAILLTVRCDKPYSAAEYDMYTHLKKAWGDKDFCARLFLAFTFAGPSSDSISKLLDESSQLSSVFREAVGRNITVDNPAIQEKSEQRATLIGIMEALDMEEQAPRPPVSQRPEYQAIIIGKTGTGKSTVGNILLDEPGRFPVGCSMDSTTTEADEATITLQNDDLKVVDTPDLCNMDLKEQEMKDTVGTWKQMLDVSKQYAILLTVRCDRLYTAEEYAIYLKMKKLWGDSKLFSGRLIVVFTFGDRLDGKIEEQLKTVCPELQQVLNDADWRYIVLNDCAEAVEKREQRELLLTWVKSLSDDMRGKCQAIVIGKTGTGKSTVGNILLDKPGRFPVGCGMNSITTMAEEETIALPKDDLKVVDTPDLCNMDLEEQEMKDIVDTWKMKLDASKPYAILLTVACDRRYTAEEYAVYLKMKKLWGNSKLFGGRLLVVFTFGDRLNGRIEEQLKIVCPELQEVLTDAGKRYVVLNDCAEAEEKREQRELLFTMLKSSSETLKEIRLIAIGKTGAGKSSAGNTIMGEEMFKPVRGWGSGTVKCDWKGIKRNGMWIQMTDTPGVCDTHRTQDEIHREISKCIGTVTPGPHAVLMVVKAGDRFTKEEADAYEELKRLFGEELTKYMIVVFTGMDFLEKDNITLDAAMQKAPEKVHEIVKEASGRYICFNNDGLWDARRKQGDKLLAIVDQLIAENRGYYSNDLIKKFDQEVTKEAEDGATVEEVKKGIVQGDNETFFAKVKGFFTAKMCTVM